MSETINFLDLKKQYLQIKEEVDIALRQVCEATAFSAGPFVDRFEKHFAQYCNVRFVCGVNSGTSALHLALLALGIKPTDEVIVPANTFIATAWAVSYVNATLVFADCDPDTWNIDVASIEKRITERTKAIIGVHLYGQPFDIDAVKAVAKKHGLFLVEDCAQAQGSRYKKEIVGKFGEMGCFSFYPGKNLGAYGEGGAVATNREEYYEHIAKLKNHGSSQKYYHDEIGYNMRMDGFQGAVLDVKLKYLESWNDRRRHIARRYQSGIKNARIKMQLQPEWSESNYHLFVVATDRRDDLMEYLKGKNVYCAMHYPVPCHLQKAYAHLGNRIGDCPNSEYLASHCLTLPMYAELTDEEVERVIDLVNSY